MEIKKDLEVLLLRDERKLNEEELLSYYKELRKYLGTRNLTNTTPFAREIGPKSKENVEKGFRDLK